MSPVLLLSNWYSGATLLSLLLDSHPSVVCNGETFPFAQSDKRRHLCSCGFFIDQCEFYNQTTTIKPDKDFPHNWDYRNAVINPRFHQNNTLNRYLTSPVRESALRRKLIASLGISKRLNEFVAFQQKFMQRALEVNAAKIYIDGTKSIRRAQLFANYSGLEKIKVIHLIRDGRAFCNSFRKNRKISEAKVALAAQEWNDYINLVDKLQSDFDNIEVTTIRYEDLCREKNNTAKKLATTLNLDSEQNFEKSNSAAHILGNRMRKNFDFNIKEDLSWRDELSSDAIDNITSVMSKNLARFKYL